MCECIITLAPSGESRTFLHGTLLADALFDMGVVIDTPCGGKGTCGKCGVRIAGPTFDSPVRVLTCGHRISGDLMVYVPPLDSIVVSPPPLVESEHVFGVAVDIGTTTVRISLVDTITKKSFEITSFLNPQRRFGHDVISRIAYGRNPEKSSAMCEVIRKAIQMRLREALMALSLPPDNIKNIVFSGNTTMLYLLFGLDVAPLGRHPFAANVQDFPACLAREIGLDVIGAARVLAMPVCGAFTGGDLIGALGLCGTFGLTRHVFFIDLGTNGELFVLDGSGKPFLTSCAMGPALEGMNISSGMTAHAGAITHIYEEGGSLVYTMIGVGKPAGITGTALIDLIAILLEHGVVSGKGVFARQVEKLSLTQLLRFNRSGNAKKASLCGEIGLTQKDIRQVQLAKAASHSAALLLLQAAGLETKDIEHVIIAGAFSEKLDLLNFMRLGFIPDFPQARQRFIGNASLQAAEKVCIAPGFIDQAKALRGRCREVPLSVHPEFQQVFLRSLTFEQ